MRQDAAAAKVILWAGLLIGGIALLLLFTGQFGRACILSFCVEARQTSINTNGAPNQQSAIINPTEPFTLSPTYTPLPSPTNTKIANSTSTPIPPPTAIPDTTPGTILELGDTWQQGGLALTLIKREFGSNKVSWVAFRLNNLQSKDRVVQISRSSFTAIDNTGRKLLVGGGNFGMDVEPFLGCDSYSIVLAANSSMGIQFQCSYSIGDIAIGTKLDDPSQTDIIIIVSGISSINNARWHLEINR